MEKVTNYKISIKSTGVNRFHIMVKKQVVRLWTGFTRLGTDTGVEIL
jgi:hypothetical protein